MASGGRRIALDIQLEMGITRREFSRTLPNAVSPFRISDDGSRFVLTDDHGRQVVIALEELAPRVIAGLSIPVAHVQLSSADLNEEEAEAFMVRFHRYFHRGGG